MKQYLDLLNDIVTNGRSRGDRTGTGTISVFGRQSRYDLSKGFPLLTTKKVNIKAIIHELLWFLKGDTCIRYLNKHGVGIWDEWASNGELGPVYGKQWRSWSRSDGGVTDQISEAITTIKNNPNSRRIIVSAWNVEDLPNESMSPQWNVEHGKMALAPCHTLFQFYVHDGKLSCQLYQRSGDIFLGVPYNIASYALLTMMMAQVCGLGYGELIHTLGDAHIYNNHMSQVRELLSRSPGDAPTMVINPDITDIDHFELEDFTLVNYRPMSAISAPISI